MEDNTSGHGVASVVPPEVDRWNWGAFLLNWVWGLGNSTYIALLMFAPLVNFVIPFVLGARGSVWAWRNRRWQSVAHFKHVQRLWAIWGVVAWVALLAIVAAGWFSIMALFKSSEAYQMGLARVQASSQAVAALGTPITGGYPMGKIETSGPSGVADLQFSVQGPKGKGTVYLHATKSLGAWKLDRIELEIEGRSGRINLGEGDRVRREDDTAVASIGWSGGCRRPASCL